jgi:phosphoribosylformylglycinamidine synthase
VFARIEVAVRPELLDPVAQGILRTIELANPELRKKIRWARLLDVYWVDMPISREELIPAVTEICWDPVLQWLFTGNLIPSAAGKNGGLQDLMQLAPHRPGKFWGIERRFRPGVTDNVGKTLLEAFEIVLERKIPDARTSSGGLLILEGPDLDEDTLAQLAREVFCNELIETWTLVPEEELKKNDRFHQERIKYDLPRVITRSSDRVETIQLGHLADPDLEELSKKKLWALSLAEMKAIQNHYSDSFEKERRAQVGLSDPTDVELEVLAQTWSEHCKHKIFGAKIHYVKDSESSGGFFQEPSIPKEINSLFKTTIVGTTADLPKPWLLSVFDDNAGICAFDEEDAFCIKVETHNSPSALDPYGGALTGIVGVNRDILGCGMGAKPIFNTDVFCVASPSHHETLPDRLLHPRRVLEGVRHGVEHGGNKSGIPTINGALVFDQRYLGKPLVYCGTGGFLPRKILGENSEVKKILPGDRICMVGGRIGKDGIHGATFSSLALDEFSPTSAVQLGDPITQKRMADFILDARDLGLYRAITDNGAGGLSSSVGELSQLSGGALMDVSRAKTKYPGLKPYELVISESQERMTLAVPPEKMKEFITLAERRGVEVSDLGEFTDSGRFEITHAGRMVASLDLKFLHKGAPQLELTAEWKSPIQWGSFQVTMPSSSLSEESYQLQGAMDLLDLMSRPNIASKEWLIRQYDHEVQGTSVIKPLHTAYTGMPQASSGPNDAGVVKPKFSSEAGITIGCGINPKLSDIDPFLMAQSAVDEAVRNVLCVGAEYGQRESVMALVDNFCWPDPVGDPLKTAWLVRACYGLRDAALALSTPLVSGKDSMKNDFRGWKGNEKVTISVPPTLLMTAVAKVPDVKMARTSDFKSAGDIIYLLGPAQLGLLGSELATMKTEEKQNLASIAPMRLGVPQWNIARRLYSWIGGTSGKHQNRIRSLHDVSEGGLLVAVAECILAKGMGATIQFPADWNPWEMSFGEGFHTFITSFSEEDALIVESEWKDLGIPFLKLGTVESQSRFEVLQETPAGDAANGPRTLLRLNTQQLRKAWTKEGYWE